MLRRLREPAPPRPEQCGLCGRDLPPGHRHLVDVEERALACTCTACALLFQQQGAAGGRYRTVPDRYLADSDGAPDERVWSVLGVPVGTVFLLRNAVLDRLLAFYPGPAGATESEVDEEAWQRALGGNRLAAALEPDVEALLLRRTEGRVDCFLVPVDVCYELVGRLRRCWHGFDGGAEARSELDLFFGRLADRAAPLPTAVTA
ncbi:DUF5947 family protein [Kitasatospora sp. NPDC089797]|uniref:DUF5947 family protein n=1 Tax=Kitasatospora sp. NPDC089797 TaxID=3155298 RepID=UPI00343E1432